MTLSPAPAETTEAPVTSPEKAGASHLERLKGSRGRSQAWAAYLFLAPWLIGLFAITLGPMLASLYLSFTNYNLLERAALGRPRQLQPMFIQDDPRSGTSLRVTLHLRGGRRVPLQLAFALALAIVLNQGLRGADVLPLDVLPAVAARGQRRDRAALAADLRRRRPRQRLLGLFGFHGPAWIADPDYALWTLILLHVWTFGSPMIIFLAGLRQIPRDLYEAASVDGAGPVAAVLEDHPADAHPGHLLQPGPADDQRVPDLHPVVHRQRRHGRPGRLDAVLHAVHLPARASRNFEMGYASAMAWVLLLIIAVADRGVFLASRSTGSTTAGDK